MGPIPCESLACEPPLAPPFEARPCLSCGQPAGPRDFGLRHCDFGHSRALGEKAPGETLPDGLPAGARLWWPATVSARPSVQTILALWHSRVPPESACSWTPCPPREAAALLPRAGPLTARSPRPVSRNGRHACPLECARSLREQTPPLCGGSFALTSILSSSVNCLFFQAYGPPGST